MADMIGPVLEVLKLVIDPLSRQFGYCWNHDDHVENLKKTIETLQTEMEKLKHSVKDEEREGKKIMDDVDTWVNEANEFIKNAEPLLTSIKKEDGGNDKRKAVFCSDWSKHYRHGRKAKKMSEKVEEHVRDKVTKFGGGSFAYNGPVQGAIEPVKDYEDFQSRRSIFKNIMDALKSPGVTKIGVYGINGAGKTFLVRAIAFQANKEQLVDEVAMATVFQEQNLNEIGQQEAVKPDIKRIQEEITDCLKFKLQSNTENTKADELRKRLKEEKKIKRLIILDDIWVGFKLEDVGIPDDHDGCKILMTSTDESVLSGEMGSQNFQLNLLDPFESLEWFKKMVGGAVRDHEISRVADKIVAECDGLPILLVSVANGLKYKKGLSAWEDTLSQLSTYDKETKHRHVDLGLRLGLNRLKHDARRIFLLCGQFPPNSIYIDYLLRYTRGLDLFQKKCHSLGDTRKKLLDLVSHLKASSLLQKGYDQGILMMHNIVHRFIMSVQSEEALTMLPGNELRQWSDVDLEKYTTISLYYCKFPELPDEFKCPNLNFLLLYSDDSTLKIPGNFFSAMGKLKVLDLTDADFSSSLPQSLQSLTNLQTLCLDECELDGVTNMEIIGQLNNLKILSFRGSDIVKLPIEIKQLGHLELLDLSDCQELEEIPETLLSGLKRLEDLHMKHICLNWEFEGTKNKLNELASLTCLSTLNIHIADPMKLTTDLFSEKLERFRILIGEGWDWFDLYSSSKTLKLKLNGDALFLRGVRVLMKKVEELYLGELDAGKTSLREIDVNGFPQLKHLYMNMVSKIEYINSVERVLTRLNTISSERRKGSSPAFTMLESLYLDNLQNLKKISHGKFIAKSFGKLRILKVKNCPAMKNLFSTSMANGLSHLEKLTMSDCENLEVMAVEEREDDTDKVQNVTLPKLQKLTLKSLPKFTRFGSKTINIGLQNAEEVPNTKPLFDEKFSCPNLKELKLSSIKMEKILEERVPGTSSSSSFFQNLTRLSVDGCDNLTYLFSSSMLKFFVSLERLWISNCTMMKEVIMMEGFQEQVVFRQLKDLYLNDLPELAGFCSCILLKFPSLTSLQIDGCPKLRCFVSNSNGESNAAGTEDDMTDSALFNEEFSCPNLKELELSSIKMEKILQERVPGTSSSSSFENLTRLSVDGCNNLTYLFSFSMLKFFVSLERVGISNCTMMKEVIMMEGFQEQVVFPQLNDLCLEDLPELAGFCSCILLKFPALTSLQIDGCPKLRNFVSNSNGESTAVGTEDDMTDSALFNNEVAFPNLNNLAIENMTKLKMIWDKDLHENSFCKLRGLSISNSNKLLKIFPSSYAQTRLQNLEVMSVMDCESLKEVFDFPPSVNENECNAIKTAQLAELSLRNLPNLRRIWTKEALEFLSFQNIQEVRVIGCSNLKSLFPVFLAKELRELREVSVVECGVQEIISMDKAEEEEETFRFPQLTSLELEDLPELQKFYSGRHTLECPALKYLHVNCDKVIFKSDQGLLEIQSKPAVQASEIFAEDTSATLASSGELPINFQEKEHSDDGPPSEHETRIKVTIDEQTTSTQFEVSNLAFPTLDYQETSSLQEDTTQKGLVLHKATHISLQIQKHSQEFNKNEQPSSDVFPTAVDFFTLSTVANSTMSSSSKESNHLAFLPHSESEDLLKQHQELSYKHSSSSVTGTIFHNSGGASSDNSVHSMDFIKKVVKKNLTEVARSTDAHHLLINLINLKNSSILNSRQAEVIQEYIDNFDSLVAYHPFYEQQLDMGTSALVLSIEEKQKNIANLNALYQGSAAMTKTLSETKEALKKMVEETEAEENRIRVIMEGVQTDLIAKKGELETDISILSKAESRQQEAAEKARKANDAWENLRNLFT